jgi:hypothetical protein
MPAGPLLCSEPLSRYRALGLSGDPVWRSAGQLRAAVSSRLSRAHADLLAIPEVDPSGQRVDWYAPVEGEVRKLADLSPGERTALLEKVRGLHGDLTGLADLLDAPERSGAEHGFARLLRQALTAPGEETLYAVGNKPVMAFWGFSADAALPGAFITSRLPEPTLPVDHPARGQIDPGGQTNPGSRANPGAIPLTARRAAPQAMMASAPAVMGALPATRSTWWQWLLLAALLLSLLALLAWLIRPYLPHLEPQLEAEAREQALRLAVQKPQEIQQARTDTLVADNERLRLELARLTDQLAHKGGDCAAGILIPGVLLGTGPGGTALADAKPIERGAGPDIMKDNKPEPGVGPDKDKPQGANTPDDKGDKSKADANNAQKDKMDAKKDEAKPMVVPPEAKQKQTLAFLKGDWQSRTGLATAKGEQDLRPHYALNDQGKGKVSFVQKNGAVCQGPAEAGWEGGKLVIDETANPKCSDGSIYARNKIICDVGPDGAADCKGSQPGDNRSYRVQIGR